MYTKLKKSNIFKFLIITMILHILLPMGISNLNIFSKETNGIKIINMENDPYTGNLLGKVTPGTLDNGRAWVDKSVNKEGFSFENDINISPNEKEFLVALSALSQSYPVKQEVKIPVDIVFMLDLSTSMQYRIDTNQTAGQVQDTRAYHMVEALNKAIKIIMDANPEHNRVAVVAYSGIIGDYRVENSTTTMLGLTNIPSTAGPNYFTCTGSSVSNMVINCTLPDSLTSRAVSGGTPTQIGIYKGAKILESEPTTTYTYTRSNGEPATVKRQPAMILLSDGEPTLGWTNYESPSGERDIGTGSPTQPINFGADFMTIAEAAKFIG